MTTLMDNNTASIMWGVLALVGVLGGALLGALIGSGFFTRMKEISKELRKKD